MKSANSQRYQDLLEDYRFIRKSVASSSESGIIKFNDSNPFYKEITQKNIDNIRLINVFDNDKLNLRYQKANKELLAKAMQYNIGTEVSIVYDTNMKPIKGYNYVVGDSGSVTINNPNIPYHAFHNHPSGETFSVEDLLKYCNKEKMISITAIGNNLECYSFFSTKSSDKFGYKAFLDRKLDEKLFGTYTFFDLRDLDLEQFDISTQNELKNIIENFTNECIAGGLDYGFKYFAT